MTLRGVEASDKCSGFRPSVGWLGIVLVGRHSETRDHLSRFEIFCLVLSQMPWIRTVVVAFMHLRPGFTDLCLTPKKRTYIRDL